MVLARPTSQVGDKSTILDIFTEPTTLEAVVRKQASVFEATNKKNIPDRPSPSMSFSEAARCPP
jgi:hypothetical protein